MADWPNDHDQTTTPEQTWFILISLMALALVGALGLVFGADPDVAGTVFFTPLVLLALWGFSRMIRT